MKDIKLMDYHGAKWDEPIIMTMGTKGERGIIPPAAEEAVVAKVGDWQQYVPTDIQRPTLPSLPEISQYHVLRHFLRLSQMTMGMETGIDISEGTCTMKYSPKLHEAMVRSSQMCELHPYQDESTVQGILEIVYRFGQFLQQISGMDEFSFQAGGGSHAVFANACIVRKYHQERGELAQRREIITTIFSHPCDSATPATAGFDVINLMPNENGYPDIEALRSILSPRTAGIMITNPEDTGIYNPQIAEIVQMVHDVGGLCFYDQANSNGILGIARAREAGFDSCHFNLHKTFSSPHGCEGPAGGVLCVREHLAKYLPVPTVGFDGEKYFLDSNRPDSIGKIRSFMGNWQVVLRAYAWVMSMGAQGLRLVAETAVLNNNYLTKKLLAIPGVTLPYAQGHRRLDQGRFSLEELKEMTGFGTEDIQRRFVDFGIQSYWLSHHPWVVPEPFTPEPCETYSREDCDYWAKALEQACHEAQTNPALIEAAPHGQAKGKLKDHDVFEVQGKWSSTWRAHLRKQTQGLDG